MSETARRELPRKAQRLASHLRERVREEGELYVKSRYVAEDVDLSAKEIGSYMPRVDAETELTVEQWAYTNGTTWRVTEE